MLTDIKHVFFTNPLGPAYATRDQAATVPNEPKVALEFMERPGGQFEIGARGDAFRFDNETPRHRVLVDEHSLANRLITNAEYAEFVNDRGYSEPALWLSDGFSILQRENWSRPLYWSQDKDAEFTLYGWRPLEPDAPVAHLSYYEADAFARWAGARLPSEAEWELAATENDIAGNTLDTGAFRPTPVTAGTAPKNGIHQLWGDVWEWTQSPYAPYPRFKPLAGSLGEYNGKFMSNQMVVRGGSCATWASHLRASYRSFFYPHDRWQFLGLRLAQDI